MSSTGLILAALVVIAGAPPVKPSAQDIAGRLAMIKGTVEWRPQGASQAKTLTREQDLCRLIHVNDELKLAADSAVSIKTGAETVLLTGPLDWYKIRWTCPDWDARMSRPLVEKQLERSWALAGRNRGDGEGPDRVEPAESKMLAGLLVRARCRVRVGLSDPTDAELAAKIAAEAPLFVEIVDVADADVVLRSGREGIRLQRPDNSRIGVAPHEGSRALTDMLVDEAVFVTFLHLSAGVAERAERIVSLSLNGRGSGTVEVQDGDPLGIRVRNSGSSAVYVTLWHVSDRGTLALLTDFDKKRLPSGEWFDFAPKAVAEATPRRELVVALATDRPVDATAPTEPDWSSRSLEFRVVPKRGDR